MIPLSSSETLEACVYGSDIAHLDITHRHPPQHTHTHQPTQYRLSYNWIQFCFQLIGENGKDHSNTDSELSE